MAGVRDDESPVITGVVACERVFDFLFQAEDGIRDDLVTGVQTCALPIFTAIVRGIVGEDYKIISNIVAQSPEIARGVDTGGAGDQGIMKGYATSETESMMPRERSEERRVGKECRSRWSPDH